MTSAGAAPSGRVAELGATRVAYLDEGAGPPLLLLHGCPFASFVWRKVIPRLGANHRCLAPDLLGLGDTETPPGADWSLRAQADMVTRFLDALDLERVDLVGHDHGGATAQLLAAEHPERIGRLVLMNAEAYDNWPSREERPFIRLTQLPLLGRATLWLYGRPPIARAVLAAGRAVEDRGVLDADLVGGFVGANLADARRRAKTRCFLRGQLDPANRRLTLDALDGLRRFDHPTLLLWARDDPHFGPEWAERLREDIPGARRLEILPDCGHLVMEEKPERVAELIAEFLADPTAHAPARSPAERAAR
jgi:pimeloyl-ACP methyl ester carboxylesterase